jgi:outer membrane protein assembly factor BamB
MLRRRIAIAAGLVALSIAPAAGADPIVDPGTPSLPAFQGAPATPDKVKPSHPEQNPYMATNPNSNIHNDTWMTDAYRRPGPLGNELIASSASGPPSLCGSIAFDSAGHLVSVCPSIVAPPVARVFDPVTLATLAEFELPHAPDPPGTVQFQNFSGGGYFFLDERDRMWIPTKTGHIFVLKVSEEGTSLTQKRDYDLTRKIDEATERITSALPDFNGMIWFVTKQNGRVGTLDPKTGEIRVKTLGEEIENSFAVGSDGVYIVSDRRMYRFKATKNGVPRVIWKAGYPNSGIVKPSQVNAGSGTTPTIMDGGYVAITDNADPMDIVVYRTARKLRGEKRKACVQPVFEAGASATENSLLTAGRSLIVENNYGYQDPFGPNAGALTEPGFARVDLNKKGTDCKLKWTNTDARGATVVPKLSTKTGLIYTYTRPPDPAAQGYYWTAIDWHTGETVWSRYAGSGLTFNNNYAGIALGADGTAYLGVIGGLIALRDGG